jgi:hypothetical protein
LQVLHYATPQTISQRICSDVNAAHCRQIL